VAVSVDNRTSRRGEESPRAVVVTGASSGIGQCVARGLLWRGYRVFATARRVDDLERLAGEGLEPVHLELSDSESVRQAADRVLDRCRGGLYGLFNNAGYGLTGAVEDLSREALRAQFEANVFGPAELTNRLLPAMRRQGAGRIVNNSSVLGLVALPFRGAYCASKFALEALTDSLRLELAGSGIRVSLIEPGPIDTRFRASAYRAFKESVDPARSPHREAYQTTERRLSARSSPSLLSGSPEAVLKCVIHALESERPKIRYHVTAATSLLAALRRLLPYRAMDWVAMRADR
jgi:NAD(P)-dependent dehydrogenase (short-subunit alcohol dehydrogenase family)